MKTMERYYNTKVWSQDHYYFIASKKKLNGSPKTHLVFLTSEKEAHSMCGVGVPVFEWHVLYEKKQTINGIFEQPLNALMSSSGCKNCQKYYNRFSKVIQLG